MSETIGPFELNRVHCGDCLELMKELPDGSVDLVVTDPPYGIDYQSQWRKDRGKWKPKIYGDKEFPLWLFDIVNYKCAMYVWCRWDVLHQLPVPKSFIVWDKMNHSMGDLKHEYGRQWEGIVFYPGKGHEFINRPVDIIRFMRINPTSLIHPNQKPVGVTKILISANKGAIILDPFAGSGTTGVAAIQLNRKFIGFEIDPHYCEIANDRIAAAKRGQTYQQYKSGQEILPFD